MLFCIQESNNHRTKTHENTGNISGHKQGGNGYAACYGRIYDKCAGRRNQKSCGGRCNIDSGGKCRIIALVLLDRVNAAAHSGSCGNRGTGQSAEKHVSHNIGLSQGAGDPANEKLCKVYKASGDTAVIHNVAGQNKQRNGQQGKAFHTAVHFLHGNKGDLIPGQGRDCGNNGRNYNTYGNRAACKQKQCKDCKQDNGSYSDTHASFPPSMVIPVISSYRLIICAAIINRPETGAMA